MGCDSRFMILVTGATGTIGGHVARLLTRSGVPFRAMSRKPMTDGVQADFTDPASLVKAVAGVDAVFLVTVSPVPSADHDIALLTAAREAGVRKIVKLSALGTGERFEGATVGVGHLAAEEAIESSGLAWTILRPPSFASNVLQYRALIAAEEPLPSLLGDTRQGIVDPRDVAAVAVAALRDSAHDGRRYDLTGPELLTFASQAAVLGRVLGRPVEVAEVDPRALWPGMPEETLRAVSTDIGWARAGGSAYLTDDVSRVLGRAAGTFEGWVLDHRAQFTGMR